MMPIIMTIFTIFGFAQGAATYTESTWPFTNGGNTDPSTEPPPPPSSSPFVVSLPQNDCGYSNVEFDTSLNGNLMSNDTIWFYETNLPSNCGPQESDLGCVGEMYMTGDYSFLGKLPYTVWYYFSQEVDSIPMVSLYFNYNNSATHLVDTIPCNGVSDYKSTLSKCMFSEELYHYQFYTQYLFNFYTTCSYNADAGTINFNLDQESITCVDGTKCNQVRNRFNDANFNDWQMKVATVGTGAVQDFCIPPPPPPPTTTDVTDTTDYPVETTTTDGVPTETETVVVDGKPCKSCHGVVITITNHNENTNVNTVSSTSNSN
jgi:hypothetical protein